MNFTEVEDKWQKFWEEHPGMYRAEDDSDKPKKYVLVEFPYPSGSGLHVGHAFSFTGGDIYARFKRMQGYNVLFPMGWDAFGLPTENYAIKMKRKPQEITKENTDMFRRQMKRLAFSFDWSREVNTTDPNYYKWTQWIFIQLFKAGLAEKQEMPINWCPKDKIGLANEEVIDGRCERCGSIVERRTISQWVVKITKYADRLLDGLPKTDFIEKVKAAQINWIGKSEGARIRFKLSPGSTAILSSSRPSPPAGGSDDSGRKIESSPDNFELEVFTTRPDTLYGATFMVVAPEHELVNVILNEVKDLNRKDSSAAPQNDRIESIKSYVKNARSKSDLERTELNKEKTGVFSGLYAINPVNGKEIPIWISDFVLASYGTGAIMAVPAHDERDWAFAKKFGLEIIPVIEPAAAKSSGEAKWDFDKAAYTEVNEGIMVNSPNWEGMKPNEAIKKAIEWLKEKGIGEGASSYHLRDWIFSRQHYWGEPIPMIYCEECAKNKSESLKSKIKKYAEEKKIKIEVLDSNPGWYPVPEDQLPVRLPEVEAYEPTDDGKSPLSKIESFVKTICPICGKEAKRETDTMPNWAGSDWYFMRYCDPLNDTVLASQEMLKKWMPVDVYIGGDEHNTLHLLYSRFIYQFLNDIGAAPKEIPEPYYRRLSHGVILGPDNQRMSKSHGNVIVPETVADKYGVDVLRLYLMFMGPFDGTMAWNEKTLMGVKRFLERFEKYINKQMETESDSSRNVKVIINKLIKGVEQDIENHGYNTVIAKLMEAINKISNDEFLISKDDLKILVKLLSPMAPYTSEELWHNLGETGSVQAAVWPKAEEKYLVEEKVTIPVAVNGKVREEIVVDIEKINDKKFVLDLAKNSPKIKVWIDGPATVEASAGKKEILKEIYIPGKMVNFVIK